MNSKGQIWIETVLYTLIALALIGVVLSFVYPKISAAQEKILVEQTLESFHALDEIIITVQDRGEGNSKKYEFTMKRGKMTIDGDNDNIILEIQGLNSQYSEPGVEIQDGRIKLKTVEGQKTNSVLLTLDYSQSNIDIRVNREDELKEITQAPTPHILFVVNREEVDPATNTRRQYISME